MRMLAADLRQSLRAVLKTPLFSGVVMLLLALGIGANTLIFTAVDALLLRPLAVARPEQLLRLGVQASPTHVSYEHPYLYKRFLAERSKSFSDVFASWQMEMALGADSRLESITGLVIRDAAWSVVPGLMFGAAIYGASSRATAALLYGVSRWDPLSMIGAAAGLAAVCAIATILPAL